MASPKATFTITAVDKTKAAFKSINNNMRGLERAALRTAAAIASVGAAGAVINTIADDIAEFGRTTRLLGITSVEAFNKITAASEEVGISVQTTATGIQRLARRAQEAAQGNQQLTDAFAEFGITAADLRNLAPDEIFFQMAGNMDRAREAGVDLTSAMKVLDTEGLRLLLTMERLNTDGFEEAWKEMQQLGAVIDDDLIMKSDALATLWDRTVGASIQSLKNAVIESAFSFGVMAGAIDAVTDASADLAAQNEITIDSASRINPNLLTAEELERTREDTLRAQAEANDAIVFGDIERAKKQKEIDDRLQADRERNAQTAIQSAARNSKLFFEIDKARAVAQAALSAREAVLGAYAFGAKLGGPALGAAFAAAAGAATAVQIAAIASQQFGAGGGGVATGGPGGQSATAGELAGQPRQQINIEFVGGSGVYDENTIRNLIDLINEVNEDGSPSLSGRFTVE